MAKNIQNLIKLSSKLRELSIIIPRISQSMPVRSYQTSSQHYMNEKHEPVQYYMSELPKKKFVKVSRSDEYHSNAHIFQVIQTEETKIDGYKAVLMLEALLKLNKTKEDIVLIRQKKEFSLLCEVLKRDSRQLTGGYAVTALKCLIHFEIPTTTVITQMMLQIIRQTINTLSLDQIIFLDFLLNKCRKTPLVDALIIALPIVFETHVQTKLDMDNTDLLIKALGYLKKSPSISNDTTLKIVEVLNKTDISNVSPQMALRLLYCCLDLPIKDPKIILTKVLNALNNSVDLLQPFEISTLVYELKKKQYTENSFQELYYNENLLDNCITNIITKDMGFDVAIDVLNNLSQMPHVSLPLLDYIASMCYDNKELLKNTSHREIEVLVRALALANYKPVFWDTIKDNLFQQEMLNCSNLAALKLAINYSILDCYWPKLLEKVFTNNFLKFPGTLKKILFLYHNVKINYPQYQGTLPTDEIIHKLKESLTYSTRTSLKSALEVVTGGEQYISSYRTTKFGYFIDHVVVMRKGGFPVAINSIEEQLPLEIENFKVIPDSQVILFIMIPNYGYIKNTRKLSGFWTILLGLIREETGHTVIPISSNEWNDLSEAEQVRYLSKTLRLETNEFSAINT